MADPPIRYGPGGVAWVSGAGSGLGRALTLALDRRGVTVLAADIDAGSAAATAAGSSGTVSAQQLDVTDADRVRTSIMEWAHRHGRLDLVINNAGIGGPVGDLVGVPPDRWREVLDVNVGGVIHGTAAALSLFAEQGFGHIVNTASLAGLVPTPGLTVYTGSKHAIVGLSLALRLEVAPHGVRVSVLCPAALDTPLLDASSDDGAGRGIDVRRYLTRLAGIGPPERFAEAALRGLERDRPVIHSSVRARGVATLQRLAPGTVARVAARALRRELPGGAR